MRQLIKQNTHSIHTLVYDTSRKSFIKKLSNCTDSYFLIYNIPLSCVCIQLELFIDYFSELTTMRGEGQKEQIET